MRCELLNMREPLPSGPFGVRDDDARTLESLAVYVKLLRATRSVVLRVERLVADHGLTLTQLGVLEGILHKGPLTHRELGRMVLTSAGNITDVIDKLESRELVLRVRDTVDRRIVRVELTAKGSELIEQLFPLHAADIAAALAGLSQADLRTLAAMLRRLGTTASLASPCAPESPDTFAAGSFDIEP